MANAFKSELTKAFRATGFVRFRSLLRYDGEAASVLVEFQKGFGTQWHINVGFCLNGMSAVVPDRLELSSLYFRCEGLFPKSQETVRAAGELDPRNSEQESALQDLVKLVEQDFAPTLKGMTSSEGLREAWIGGRLSDGFVGIQVRAFLDERYA